jgi:hypothetical protein
VMLSRFGLRKTMLMKAGIDAVVLGTAYLLLKERRKPSAKIIWYDKKYLTDPTFWSVTLCLCGANVGYPMPYYYLPTFAKQKIPDLTELVSTNLTVSWSAEGLSSSMTAFRSLRHRPQHFGRYRPLLRRISR